MNQNIVVKLLFVAEMYDKALSETQITGYVEALADLPEELVLQALGDSVKTCDFFPRVSQIRELAGKVIDRQRDQERAQRIREQSARRRLEVDEWRHDRARRGLSAPTHIGGFVFPAIEALAPLTEEQIAERKEKLAEQARAVEAETPDDKASEAE